MKIVEGIKKLKLIEKRMMEHTEQIKKYSSIVSCEKPVFGTELEQRRKIAELEQSNMDLCTEYLKIKKNLEFTNLVTPVTINKITYSISDLISIKRKIADIMIKTQMSKSEASGNEKLRLYLSNKDRDNTPSVVILYDEQQKNDRIRFWQDLKNEIDSTLEVVNATTDMKEFPNMS